MACFNVSGHVTIGKGQATMILTPTTSDDPMTTTPSSESSVMASVQPESLQSQIETIRYNISNNVIEVHDSRKPVTRTVLSTMMCNIQRQLSLSPVGLVGPWPQMATEKLEQVLRVPKRARSKHSSPAQALCDGHVDDGPSSENVLPKEKNGRKSLLVSIVILLNI